MSPYKAGIVEYGVYLPHYRLRREESDRGWETLRALGIAEKTVANYDEDAVTMSVAAGRNALQRSGGEATDVDALYLASCSFPYAEKGCTSTVAVALGLRPTAATAQFSGSSAAGTSALLAGLDGVACGRFGRALVIAAEASQGIAGEPLGDAQGAGAVAFLLGRDGLLASYLASGSASEEVLGERFRRDGEGHLEDLELRPYRADAFIRVVGGSVSGLLQRAGLKGGDFQFVALQQGDARSPLRVAKALGFTEDSLKAVLLAGQTGDLGTASALLSLAAALEKADVGERVMAVSYGSGAVSDAVAFEMERALGEGAGCHLVACLSEKSYIDYVGYLRLRSIIGGR